MSTSPSTFSQAKRLFAAPTENEEDAKDSEEVIESSASNNSTEVQRQSIEEYRAKLSERGASMNKLKKEMKITMKFGGSSLANAARVDEVARIIKGQIELGYRPVAVICSAMGKTTNTLLSAGDIALQGRVDIDALRTLHMATINEFDLPEHVRKDVTKLLDEVSDNAFSFCAKCLSHHNFPLPPFYAKVRRFAKWCESVNRTFPTIFGQTSILRRKMLRPNCSRPTQSDRRPRASL